MRGKVGCQLIGGPRGEKAITISARDCRDVLGIAGETWFAQSVDGEVRIMKGPIPPRAPWIGFTREIYEKVTPVVPGQVTYRYIRTEEVNRCEKILEGKARRCRNEAESGTRFCRAHKGA